MTNLTQIDEQSGTSQEDRAQLNVVEIQTNASNLKETDKRKSAIPAWLWILIVIVVVAGVYWGIQLINQRQETVGAQPAEISVVEAAQLDPEKWFILDVRDQSEWNGAHIEGATLIPIGELNSRLDELPEDKNIVVVCQSGGRSAKGRDLLLEAGFPGVTCMDGGMNDWLSQGLPVVTGP